MAGSLPQNRGNRSANRVGATVSRRLRAAGFNISPSARRHTAYGMFVRTVGDLASVLIDYGTEASNNETLHELNELLSAWPEAGVRRTDRNEGGGITVRFTYTPVIRSK